MLALIDTVIGFAALMLVLSMLIKAATSMIKNLGSYAEEALKHEMGLLLESPKVTEILGSKLDLNLTQVNFGGLGKRYLTLENLEGLAGKDLAGKVKDKAAEMKSVVDAHRRKLDLLLEKRNKNLSLVVGVIICLALNINAFAVWQGLYSNQQLRMRFSSPEYVDQVLTKSADLKKEIAKLDKAESQDDKEKRAAYIKTRGIIEKQLDTVAADVDFGLGAVWRGEAESWRGLLFQFFGSLLTGILASIGAPYLHDMLRTISALRRRSEASAEPQSPPADQAQGAGGEAK